MNLRIYTLLTAFLINVHYTTASRYSFDYEDPKRDCQPHHKKCVFHFRVTQCFAMYHPRFIVYSDNRQLYGFNTSDIVKLDTDEIVTTVGNYNQRLFCINGQYPGPKIVVYQNQIVELHVENALNTEGFTFHFHGFLQKGTPNMDGVEGVTQKLIPPKTNAVYKFKASETGTYWYHSHSYLFFSLHGPAIVLPCRSQKKYKKNKEIKVRQHVVMLNDWSNNYYPDKDVTTGVNAYYVDAGNVPFNASSGSQIDNIRLQAMLNTLDISYNLNAYLMNGRAESQNPTVKLPLEVFEVKHGSLNRFRVINSATEASFIFSIDKHRLKVVASDGANLQPQENVESIVIAPAERYDVIIEANQPVGNYWIRAIYMDDGCYFVNDAGDKVLGILHYDGASISDPTTQRDPCPNKVCKTVGCVSYQLSDRTCITYNDLKSLNKSPLKNYKHPSPQDVYYLNFDDTGVPYRPHFGINLKALQPPEYIPLFNLNRNNELLASCDKCSSHNYYQNLCSCYNAIELKRSQKVAYFVFMDLYRDPDDVSADVHVVHLHGHKFEVLKIGLPSRPDPNQCFLTSNTDIHCSRSTNDTFGLSGCRKAQFIEELKDLDLEVVNPPLKDSIVVPQDGYALVRFQIDNPGIWALHCHNFYHHLGGMKMVIHERIEDLKHMQHNNKNFKPVYN